MADVDPFQLPIPEVDPSLREYLVNLDRFLKQLWERTGGSDDLIEKSDVMLANIVVSTHGHDMDDIDNFHFGIGVPKIDMGENGDFYFRSDGGLNTRIYHKASNAWAAFA